MRAAASALLFLAFVAPLRAGKPIVAPPLAPAQRTISSSGQFFVYFQDKGVRSRLSLRLEEIKRHWLQRLSLPDEWKAPIIVQLQSIRDSSAPRIATNIFEGDAGQLKVQIDVNDPSVLQGGDFDVEVYRALCFEYSYRNAPPKAGKSYTQPPAWLLEALYEDDKSRENGLTAGLYETLIDRGRMPSLEAFLKQRPWTFDATSRAIYRAQALGLFRAFLALPSGSSSLKEYLSRLPSLETTDAAALLAAFPSLEKDPSRLSRAWVLSIANASASDRLATLSVDESRKELLAILDISTPPDPRNPMAPPVRGPDAMPIIARTEQGRYILGQKTEELLRLQMRVHPLVRPIVDEYRLIANQLAMRPKKKVTDRLVKNGELLKLVTEQSDKVTDYMNWYEAARIETSSGTFTAISTGDLIQIPVRSDAISRRIDSIEARGW